MHLLNNSNASPDSSAYYPSPDLPPIQSFSSFAKSSNISLPPLEPDGATSHHEKSAPQAKTVHHIPPLSSITEEYSTGRYSHDGGSNPAPAAPAATTTTPTTTAATTSTPASLSKKPSGGSGRSLRQHANGGISLRMLFDNPEINESSHSLNHILDDVPESSAASANDDASTKKRHRAMTVKDDIMHLPQPLKKQKSSQNIMPPIINGLYEPPPNAAVFPPIALDDGGSEAAPASASMNSLKEYNHNSGQASAPNHGDVAELNEVAAATPSETTQENTTPVTETERPQARVKRKAAKPRKKWSEEETRHLLLGVNKYGVGKWTSILEDPQYRFNGRTAGDLKDRFRTCCPDELRIVPSRSKESLNSQDRSGGTSVSPSEAKPKSKTALLLEDILADPEEMSRHQSREDLAGAAAGGQASFSQHDSDSTAKPKKSRAHRKKIEDLQAMGIHGPFKKSHRRERRPFTQQDDDQILEGLQLYGPAWTKIQRDPRFDLSSRQPTDLRDRVRNKYPDMYKQIEEKQVHSNKDVASAVPVAGTTVLPSRTAAAARSNVLEPTVNNLINENSLMTLEPHLHRSGSREDTMLPKWAASLPTAPGSGPAVAGGSFHELPGMESFSREALEGEVGDVSEPSNSAAFIGMMDISRLLLDE